MNFILYLSLVMILIPFILLLVSIMISFWMTNDLEKLSSFECGFTPMTSSRLPFSLRFFLLIVVFLIFDIEIVLIYPWIITLMTYSLTYYNMVILTLILFILIIGLLHEWNQGTLNWLN